MGGKSVDVVSNYCSIIFGFVGFVDSEGDDRVVIVGNIVFFIRF